MARLVLVLLAMFLLGPRPSIGQDPGDAIRNALLAQVLGFGGCTEVTSIRPTSIRFFPGVQFFEGSCTLEHGQSAFPLAARDSGGLIYTLDSESTFHFLTLQ